MKVADLVNPAINPLPEEVQDLVAALIEGRVHSLAILAEITDADGNTDWLQGYSLDMDENISDELAFVGALGLMLKEIQEAIAPQNLTLHIKREDDDDDDE